MVGYVLRGGELRAAALEVNLSYSANALTQLMMFKEIIEVEVGIIGHEEQYPRNQELVIPIIIL